LRLAFLLIAVPLACLVMIQQHGQKQRPQLVIAGRSFSTRPPGIFLDWVSYALTLAPMMVNQDFLCINRFQTVQSCSAANSGGNAQTGLYEPILLLMIQSGHTRLWKFNFHYSDY
jgi:hypothetical protein